MKKKLIGILICGLLIATTILPASGIAKNYNIDDKETFFKDTISSQLRTCNNELTLTIDPIDSTNNIAFDTYDIYEGQYLKVTLTGYWSPPNPTKTICLWADASSMPTGATLTPPCNCALGQVSSVFEWTPAVGQAGTYTVTFHVGEVCLVSLGTFTITIIVHPSGQDNPPLVVIQSPADGTTFNSPTITVTGYATDDIGVVSIGAHHEWTGDETITSGTIPQTTYYSWSNWYFDLREGWNRITIFVYDTKNQYAEDQIVVYYQISTNHPPNKPTTPSGPTSGKTGTSYRYESYFSDPDGDSMEVFFDWGDGNNTGWIGPIVSGTSVGNYHTYITDGSYQIKTKARDIPNNEESAWSDPLPITMPYSYNPIQQSLELLFQRFPHAFPLLRQLMGY